MPLSEDFLAAVTMTTGLSAKFDKSRPRTLDEALEEVLVDDDRSFRPLKEEEKAAVRKSLGRS